MPFLKRGIPRGVCLWDGVCWHLDSSGNGIVPSLAGDPNCPSWGLAPCGLSMLKGILQPAGDVLVGLWGPEASGGSRIVPEGSWPLSSYVTQPLVLAGA